MTEVRHTAGQHQEPTTVPALTTSSGQHGGLVSGHFVHNVAVIAHVDHGKSTLTDSLVQYGGLLSEQRAGKARWCDSGIDEIERGITIHAAAVSIAYTPPVGAPRRGGAEHAVNVVDSPGHVDFSAEVTAALRVADGAIVVVDVVEGPAVQTDTVLRQALAERVVPLLVVNKCDRLVAALRLDEAAAAARIAAVVAAMNARVAALVGGADGALPEWLAAAPSGAAAAADGGGFFSLARRNVVVAAGRSGWALTAAGVAAAYAAVGKALPEAGAATAAGFARYALRPAFAVLRAQTPAELAALAAALLPAAAASAALMAVGGEAAAASTTVASGDGAALDEARTAVLRAWAPAGATLLAAVVAALPTAAEAQAYRTERIYEAPAAEHPPAEAGPASADPAAAPTAPEAEAAAVEHDAAAEAAAATTAAIRRCDAGWPVVAAYVSKLVPVDKAARELSSAARFVAFARVFCGTLTAGAQVAVLSGGRVRTATVAGLVTVQGSRTVRVAAVPAGQVCGVVGVDAVVAKTATLAAPAAALTAVPRQVGRFAGLDFSVRPVVRVGVRARDKADAAKVAAAAAKLRATEPFVEIETARDGGVVVCGAGELHVEICVRDIERIAGAAVVQAPPTVPYRETVRGPSRRVVLVRSANRHNVLWGTVSPVPEAAVAAYEAGRLRAAGRRGLTVEAAHVLWKEAGFALDDARRVSGVVGAGVFVVDKTHGVAHVADAIDALLTAAAEAAGVATGEPLRGVRVDLLDATLHGDPAHRGARQLEAAARRLICAAALDAGVVVEEPVYGVDVQVDDALGGGTGTGGGSGGVHSVLAQAGGEVAEETVAGGVRTLHGSVPVARAFGLAEALRRATGGRATLQATLSHWTPIRGDAADGGSPLGIVVATCRTRNGLQGTAVPKLVDYIDRGDEKALRPNEAVVEAAAVA